jgi:hypothetical protein
MNIEPLIKEFLSALLLDEDRQVYFTMTKEQKRIVKFALRYRREANASLIANAPELLTACQYMLSKEVTGGSEYWQGNTHKALKIMEEIIAKVMRD